MFLFIPPSPLICIKLQMNIILNSRRGDGGEGLLQVLNVSVMIVKTFPGCSFIIKSFPMYSIKDDAIELIITFSNPHPRPFSQGEKGE